MGEIFTAIEDDISELNILINSAYRGEGSKKGWTTEADLLDGIRTDEESLKNIIHHPNTFILKYSENKKLAACVLLEKQDSDLYLGMLTVSPTLQGKGVGKSLLNAAEEKAKQLQCKKIKMTVISVREELIKWYERHGYKDTGK
ncbi:MAG: GNAT family N-acetyltransferase, partial [Bacteroidota bacterium]|nr:GNAT family N-acetyltransferase [Bacteroidota bacterium]